MRSLVKSAQTQNTQSLGRLTEADELSIAPSLQNYPPIQIVLQRCVDCLSVLMQVRFNSQEQVRVGLCPDRSTIMAGQPSPFPGGVLGSG